ncbi:hypothetical protein DICVIV_11565 [Dictyocaulus viviparus]|uniref:Uncharacterized protein n=1 Tax=Dictyocaulus viviparus TaxID=29172 RepID=A0A0D8XFH2_DICVI|nr:hypothetical protein DICVIV_11565 [Dictyocaulus viviparus]
MTENVRYMLTFTLISISYASYCGQAAIPFTFQVLHSGLTVLGCAKPQCFGWNTNGTLANESAQFYRYKRFLAFRIDGKEDGYLRQSDQIPRSPSRNSIAAPSVATCEEHYSTKSCSPGQWVGGIAPKSLVHGSKLQIRCCSYAPLLNSEDRGVAMVTNGQLVVGGEVMNDDNLVSFDYIANIRTELNQSGNIVYAVSIRRMMCTDEDPEAEYQVSQNAVVHNLDGSAQMMPKKKVQEAPIYKQPLQPHYFAAITSTPHFIPQNPAIPNFSQTQAEISSPFHPPMNIPTVQYNPLQMPNTIQAFNGLNPGHQPYIPLSQAAPPAPQLFGGIPRSFDSNMSPLHPLPASVYAQSQSQVPPTPSTTPLPTIPPLTFPTLDQISKINIPSVEDVENVIPPVQKAILTTVARLFGVL